MIQDDFPMLADMTGCSVHDFLHSRKIPLPGVRYLLWRDLHEQGYHPSYIATLFEKDRCTVLNGLEVAKSMDAQHGWGDALSVYNEYKRRKEVND